MSVRHIFRFSLCRRLWTVAASVFNIPNCIFAKCTPEFLQSLQYPHLARVGSLQSSVVSSFTRVTSVKFVTNITSIAMKRVKRIRDRLCQREERVYWRSLMGVLGGVDPTWDEPTLLHCAVCTMLNAQCTVNTAQCTVNTTQCTVNTAHSPH